LQIILSTSIFIILEYIVTYLVLYFFVASFASNFNVKNG
jgi:hypothetical protein